MGGVHGASKEGGGQHGATCVRTSEGEGETWAAKGSRAKIWKREKGNRGKASKRSLMDIVLRKINGKTEAFPEFHKFPQHTGSQ